MNTTETKDTYIVGKIRQNGTVCVTEARAMADGTTLRKGRMYNLSKQVKKVLVNLPEAEDEA